MIELVRFHCLRCHHTWAPRRDELPSKCPKCYTPLWNREYQRVERISPEVMERIRGCPFRICQQRYDRMNAMSKMNMDKDTDLVDNKLKKPRGRVLPKPKQIHNKHVITKDNFPTVFRRIKHG